MPAKGVMSASVQSESIGYDGGVDAFFFYQ